MQTPRSIVRNETVFNCWDYFLFSGLSALSASSIIYFARYWLSLDDASNHPVLFGSLTVVLFVILVNNQAKWYGLLYMRRPVPMSISGPWKVAVLTTVVPGYESLVMLEHTVRALVAIDYPHDTWVLDEGGDEEVQKICRRSGAHYFSRKYMSHYQTESGKFQQGSKHGNYNAWLSAIGFERYDITTAFDPDHLPKRSFLRNVLGYFADSNVGYVH